MHRGRRAEYDWMVFECWHSSDGISFEKLQKGIGGESTHVSMVNFDIYGEIKYAHEHIIFFRNISFAHSHEYSHISTFDYPTITTF